MHELIEGLQGVEVIADDLMTVGYGKSQEEAVRDHDENLTAFLQRCADRGIKLNPEKVKLRLREVPFIGHIASDKGLAVDPTKVRAIHSRDSTANRCCRSPALLRNSPIREQIPPSSLRKDKATARPHLEGDGVGFGPTTTGSSRRLEARPQSCATTVSKKK